MNQQISELTFLKQLAPRFAILTPEFIEWPSQRQKIQDCFKKWPSAIAKPDILAGGRGKAGAMEIVETARDAIQTLQRLSSLELKGRMARTSYLVEFIPTNYEVYTAITYDSRYLSPVITISLKGGIDVEQITEAEKKTFPIDIYKGLDVYQAGDILRSLKCPDKLISPIARAVVNLWDMFITSGMQMCEVNPWRITAENKAVACDFKAVYDNANFKQRNPGFEWPEYPENISEFEEEMNRWNVSSYQGQAHVSDLNGKGILPILFGGGASTIIIETLICNNGDPMFLSDFGGNPPYERMYGTASICFKHKLAEAKVLLILGGKANNTRIDVTFQAIADALFANAYLRNGKELPVIVGRGGPGLVLGVSAMQRTLDELCWPYAIFGPETPISMVTQYTAELYNYLRTLNSKKA